jgi:hypothetical protein
VPYAWSPSAIHGAGFQNVLAAHPTDPNRLVTGGDVAGCHITTDGGEHWTTAIRGFPTTSHLGVAALCWNPVNVDQVFALVGKGGGAASGGLYVYSFTAATWTLVSNVVIGHGGNTAVAALPKPHPRSTGNLICVNPINDGQVIVGSFDDGLFRGKLDLTTGALVTEFANIGLAPSGGNTFYIRSVAFDTVSNRLWVAARCQGSAGPVLKRPYSVSAPWDPTPGVPAETATGPRACEEIHWRAGMGLAVSSDATDFGIWRNNTLGVNWTKVNDADIIGGRWQSVISVGNVAYAGCSYPVQHPTLGDNRNRICIVRCDDITAPVPEWTPITVTAANVHTTMGDSSDGWWLYNANQFMMIGASSYVASQLVLAADGDLYVAGRSTVWRSRNHEDAEPDWYPVPRGMGVTINRVVAAHTTAEGDFVNGNTDWVSFATLDGYQTIINAKPSPNTCLSMWELDGVWYAGTGERDTNTLGKVWTTSNPANSESWTDTGFQVGDTTLLTGNDSFGRDVAFGGWGTADDGKLWNAPVVAGNYVAANALVTAGTGRINSVTDLRDQVSSLMMIVHGIVLASGTFRYALRWTEDAAGAEHTLAFVFRRNGVDRYELRLRQVATGSKKVFLNLQRTEGTGTGSSVKLPNTDGVTDPGIELDLGVPDFPGTKWRFVTTVSGDATLTVRTKIWPDGVDESEATEVVWEDTDPLPEGEIGFRNSFLVDYSASTVFHVDDFEWEGSSGAGTGGKRPFGGVSFYDNSLNVVTLVAVSEDGLHRRTGSSAFAKVLSAAAPPIAGVTSKATPMLYAGNGVVFVYDRKQGIYRSTDYGVNWVRIYACTNADIFGSTAGAMTWHKEDLYFSDGGALKVGLDALTCAVDALVTTAGFPLVGPMASRDDMLVITRPAGPGVEPALWWLSVDDDGEPLWVDVADAGYRNTCAFPFDVALDSKGNLAVPLNGNGVSHMRWTAPDVEEPGGGPEPPLPPQLRTIVAPPLRTRRAETYLVVTEVKVKQCLYPDPQIFPGPSMFPLPC